MAAGEEEEGAYFAYFAGTQCARPANINAPALPPHLDLGTIHWRTVKHDNDAEEERFCPQK